MARIRKERIRIDTKTGRSALRARFPDGAREPFWQKLSTGRYLGLRLNAFGDSWIARFQEQQTKQYRALGDVSDDLDFDAAKAAAETWFRDLDRGVTGRTEDGVEANVKIACERYLADRKQNASKGNAHDARKRFERTIFGRPIQDTPLAKFRARHLKDWRDSLIGGGLSKSSADRTMSPLKAALHLSIIDGLASADLAVELKKVRPLGNDGKRRDLYLDKRQRTALLAHSEGNARDLFEAAALTGCRAGELTSATRASFDARTATLQVTGKTGSRPVLLSPQAVTLFERLATGKLPGAHLLTKDGKHPWAHSDWDELIRAAATKAELPRGVCLYTLRHSWITQTLLSGLSTLEVSKLAGTSLAMIEKHYGHLVQDVVRERLAKVDIV
jgi:integrase